MAKVKKIKSKKDTTTNNSNISTDAKVIKMQEIYDKILNRTMS